MTKVPKLESKRLGLKPLELSDAPAIYKLVKHRDVSRWAQHIPYPYPKNGAQVFIKRCQRNWKTGKSYDFAIVLKEISSPVGIISLQEVHPKKHHAEIGYWLGKPYWGRGLMTEAVRLALEFGFKKRKLKIIHGRLYETNKASGKVLEKSGFKYGGVLREERFRFGKWHDILVYSIRDTEYKKTAPST